MDYLSVYLSHSSRAVVSYSVFDHIRWSLNLPPIGRSLRFCVIAATGRRKQTGRLDVDYETLSDNLRVSDQLRALGRQHINVHVTGDKTQE